jgi:hypothetical protein
MLCLTAIKKIARDSLTCLTAICWVVSLYPLANSQTSTNKSSAGSKGPPVTNKSAARNESNPLAEVQRSVAISLLTSLADEARSSHDQTLRARIQARAADALWDTDKDRARALFYRAWEAAETVDKEGALRAEEERRKQLSKPTSGLVMIAPPPNLRGEVLKLSARRDRKLGEDFLTKFDESKEQEATSGATKTDNLPDYSDPTDPPLAVVKRLELARQLLDSGDVARALLFADPLLSKVSTPGIAFLSALRQRNTAAADQRYATLLVRTGADPSSDATAVSLLSSYVFTPFVVVTVTRRGRVSNQLGEPSPAPDLQPGLRAAFFRTAAQILLRPLLPPDQDHTSAGRVGTYFTIARLLPLFEQYAPDKVPSLREQLAALAQDAPEGLRTGRDSMLTMGLSPADPARDEVQEALSQLGGANSAAQRDKIYAGAVRAATLKGDARARDLADKIEDSGLRKSARAYVDFVGIINAIEKKNVEEALHLTRAGDLSHIQRVWAYTEIAALLPKKADVAGAIELLNEAAAEARQIDNSDPEHARSLITISTRFFSVDPNRGWEMMTEAVKAANQATGFTGEDGKITALLQTRNMVAMINTDAPTFNLPGIFASLAQVDLYRAIELAKSFEAETPRAVAIIAIASSVLNQKRK